jgi:predicted anti-sigma-YlaC factor YlaD
MSWLNGLVRILTLRCEAASALMSRELDESLPRLERAAIFCHILACNSCRRFRKQIRVIREAVRRREQLLIETDAKGGVLSPEARDRIALAIRVATRDDAATGPAPD